MRGMEILFRWIARRDRHHLGRRGGNAAPPVVPRGEHVKLASPVLDDEASLSSRELDRRVEDRLQDLSRLSPFRERPSRQTPTTLFGISPT